MVYDATDTVSVYLLLIVLPALLAAPLIILKRRRLLAWGCWSLLAAMGIYFLYSAGERFHNVNHANQQIGSILGWMALIALALSTTRPVWDRGAVLGIPSRFVACLTLFLPFAGLPLLPTL